MYLQHNANIIINNFDALISVLSIIALNDHDIFTVSISTLRSRPSRGTQLWNPLGFSTEIFFNCSLKLFTLRSPQKPTPSSSPTLEEKDGLSLTLCRAECPAVCVGPAARRLQRRQHHIHTLRPSHSQGSTELRLRHDTGRVSFIRIIKDTKTYSY